MAIVQISRIQVRRGLQQDLPQLASGEMGWSTDERRLFIGNGVVDAPDYAPEEGVTEILTEQSDFFSFINAYTFKGTEAGYTSVTGVTTLSPISRSLQNKLDDAVNVRDFGAVGNGVTDDTAAIQRAINQIFVTGLGGTVPSLRRSIKFPGGNFVISGTLLIPPGTTLIGDGKNNTILSSATGTIFHTADSKYQIDGDIGAGNAVTPQNINISNMQFSVSASTSSSIGMIDSATDVVFRDVVFVGTSAMTRLITLAASVLPCVGVTFDKCVFNGGIAGVGATGTATGVQIVNSRFLNNSSAGIAVGSYITGLVSEGNYYNGVSTPISGLTGNNYSVGDSVSAGDFNGLYSGAARIGSGRTVTLSATTNAITTLGSGGAVIDYQITDGTNYRYGSFKVNKTASSVSFDDEYTESTAGFLSANLYASSTGAVTCAVNSTATLKYNIKQFI